MGALIVDLAKALAWPAAAVALAVILYRPLSRLFEGLGARATKLSVFKIELELAAPASASSSPSLKDIKNPELAPVGDSSHMLFSQVQDERPATYAVIDIGDGEEWLTSRLFIGATMLQRMRGLECLVFVKRLAGVESKFVAVVSVSELRWRLAQRYPWLEVASARAYSEKIAPSSPIGQFPASQPIITSPTGGMQPFVAGAVVRRFIELVQDTSGGTDPDWIDLSSGRKERASWVTATLLKDLLPAIAYEAYADELRDRPRAERTRVVLRVEAPFVALLNSERQFVRLTDRRALLEKVVERTDD